MMDTELQSRYFTELAIHLQQEGFSVNAETRGLLSVTWNSQPLCQISSGCSIRYRQTDMTDLETELACNRATDIVGIITEYMRLMEKAPVLKVDGLDETYKLLADFNGAVLAGHPTEYGVQFVTWEWSYGRTGLWQGHYYGNNFGAAKQDFAVRAQLVQAEHLFTDEQLTEIYRCIHKNWKAIIPSPSKGKSCWRTRRSKSNMSYPSLMSWSANPIRRK